MRKIMAIMSLLMAVCVLSACDNGNNQERRLLSEVVSGENREVAEVQGGSQNTDEHSSTNAMRISITGGDTVLYATMYDNKTAREFIGLLPITLDAFDRIGLVKSTRLPQSISDDGRRTREYSRGSIFYWPEGPEVAFCYSDHLPETVVDIIHIGEIESGAEFFMDYAGDITIELVSEIPTQIESTE